MAKIRVLVVLSDLDALSKIYLTMVHRNFKAEACNNAAEYPERVKRLKPAVVILDLAAYELNKEKIKTPTIVLAAPSAAIPEDGETILISPPYHMDKLVQTVKQLVV